jgi:hypothetical protein
MAITAVTNTSRSGWIVNAYSADASAAEIMLAAVAGKRHVIEHITVVSGSAIDVTIGDGESSSAVETVRIGPLDMAAGSSVSIPFPGGLYCTSAKALVVDAEGAGKLCVVIQGRTE